MAQINPTQLDGNPVKDLVISNLLAASEDILKASGLTTFVQRYVYTEKETNYFIEFDNVSPRGEIRPLIFQFDREEAFTEGWKVISLELKFAFGSVTLMINGSYYREPVPVELKFVYTMKSSGVSHDSMIVIDRRIEKEELTSLKDVMSEKLKSGDPKYAGSSDIYGEIDTNRIVKILNRFLKDWCTRHRFIEKD
ncbi:hypothetical protein KKF34_12495 [Myxococcota bacterium]|nr:hypothetical protein [Myxococcota bacterium]MBU1381481.1 hypothetical protein [Myxococcota bacterium]MBU1497685.1 hypothetical protein [Myxococcota bacterium]